MPSNIDLLISEFMALISPYVLPIAAVIGCIFLVISFVFVTDETGETILNRLDSMVEMFTDFCNTAIDSVKNGFTNVIDAIKEWIDDLIPDIPSMSDIWNYVKGKVSAMIPDVPTYSEIWSYIKAKIDDTYSFAGDTWDDIKSKVEDVAEDVVEDYFADAFDTVFAWAGYSWKSNKSVSTNLWNGMQAVVEYFAYKIPGIEWWSENYSELKDALEDLI